MWDTLFCTLIIPKCTATLHCSTKLQNWALQHQNQSVKLGNTLDSSTNLSLAYYRRSNVKAQNIWTWYIREDSSISSENLIIWISHPPLYSLFQFLCGRCLYWYGLFILLHEPWNRGWYLQFGKLRIFVQLDLSWTLKLNFCGPKFFDQTSLDPKFFYSPKFLNLRYHLTQEFSNPKFFLNKNFFRPKILF